MMPVPASGKSEYFHLASPAGLWFYTMLISVYFY
jgi:hypothetical protein